MIERIDPMDTLYKELSDKLHLPILIDYLLYSSASYNTDRPTEEEAWTALQTYLEQHGYAENELLDQIIAFTSHIKESYLMTGIKLGAQIANEFVLNPQDVERVEKIMVTNSDKETVMKEIAEKLRSHYLHSSDEETRRLLADIDVLFQTILL